MTTSRLRFTLEGDNDQLAKLCGPLDENLRQISQALAVSIGHRGAAFEINGVKADQAMSLIKQFHTEAGQRELSIDEIQLGIVQARAEQSQSASVITAAGADPYQLRTRRADLKPRTPRQGEYIEQILKHDITFGTGPAGTGKTWLAVACAIDALERDNEDNRGVFFLGSWRAVFFIGINDSSHQRVPHHITAGKAGDCNPLHIG